MVDVSDMPYLEMLYGSCHGLNQFSDVSKVMYGWIFPSRPIHTQLEANRTKLYTQNPTSYSSSSSPTVSTPPDQDYHESTYYPHARMEYVSSIQYAIFNAPDFPGDGCRAVVIGCAR